MKEKWVCKQCGSEKVLQDAWVDPNTLEIKGMFDTFFCEDCEGECSLKQVEQ